MSLPGHDRPLDASHCKLCARYHSDPRYRALVDRTEPPPVQRAERKPPAPKRPDCIHLGLAIVPQPKCGCAEKLRKCDLHGTCRVSVKKDGVACCRTCIDYENPDS